VFLASGSELPDAGPPRLDSQPRPRVGGGSATTVQSWPWQVALASNPSVAGGNGYARQFCGGSLLAPTLVLTAAHCVIDSSYDATPASSLSVITGRSRLSSNEGAEVNVADWYAFVDGNGNLLYDAQRSSWDVVLVKLSSPGAGSPIGIAGADEAALWTGGRTVIATGWGETAGGSYPDQLQVGQLTLVGDGYCSSDDGWGSLFDSQTMVCAGGTGSGHDTCPGDSGGPLVAATSSGQYRLVGVTSWGQDAPCGSSDLPGVYGRVAADPLRSSVRTAAQQLVGVDVVGGNGEPADPGTSPTVSADRALDLTWGYSERQCRIDRFCRRYWAGNCSEQADGGVRCKVLNLEKSRRGRKYRCSRWLLWIPLGDSVDRITLNRWKCRWGRW
jgi:secreted trypsin-like serine protease